jgi:hypothetical protein
MAGILNSARPVMVPRFTEYSSSELRQATERQEERRQRPDEDVKRRFRGLVKQWRKETAHLSSTDRMAKHPAYQEIIGMGWPVVPLLLAELKQRPDFWFAALRAITGENPVPAESAGRIKDMARAWIEWGRSKGHVE